MNTPNPQVDILTKTINDEIEAWEKSGKRFLTERPDDMSFDAYKRIREIQNKDLKKSKSGTMVHVSVELKTNVLGRGRKLIRQKTYIRPKQKPK